MRKSFIVFIWLLAAISPIMAHGWELHGNRLSMIYHHPGCRYYQCKNCVKIFNTGEEAREAGYILCKLCERKYTLQGDVKKNYAGVKKHKKK